MVRPLYAMFVVLSAAGMVRGEPAAASRASLWDTIVISEQTTAEHLATVDLQRYVAQVTGRVPAIMHTDAWSDAHRPAILIGTPKTHSRVQIAWALLAADPGPEGYLLQQLDATVCVVGSTPRGVVNGIYGLLRDAGFRFYLGSEAIPEQLPEKLSRPHIVGRTSLAIRGVLPWYNFFNSPTTWDPIDHRTFVDQLIRMGANFVGFHTYDTEPFAAYDDGGTMKWGGRLLHTGAPTWGTHPLPTTEFACGTNLLFPADYFGAATALVDTDANAAIRREQAIMRDALDYAARRGLHTCLGFEIGGDPTQPADRDVFLRRINQVLDQYPSLDYVWIWQPETQGVQGYREQYNQHVLGSRLDPSSPLLRYGTARREVFQRVVERSTGERPFFQDNEPGKRARATEGARLEQFAQLAHRALSRRQHPPRLVICGWGGDERLLSAEYDHGLDRLLPSDVVFASLDHIIPRARVDAIYHELPAARERWPIPWLEYDGDQWHPQPYVHTYEAMFKDILAGKSQGVLGIHWRTREVEENFGYLVAASWQPGLNARTFFNDLAEHCYPREIAAVMADVHVELDRLGYRWVGGGGQGECAPFAWGPGEPAKVRQLEAIGARVAEALPRAGRARQRVQWVLDRIDWVLAFQAAQESALAAIELLGRARSAAAPEVAARLAGEALARLDDGSMGRALQAYARRVSTRGEHGVLATINTKAIVAWRDLRRQCGQILGRPVPEPDVAWPKGDRIIVPRLYGSTQANGELPIECISEGNQPTWLHYRLLGGGTWESQRLGPLRGWVQAGVVPAQVVQPPGLELVLSHEQRAPESGPMDAGSASMARFTVTVMPAAPMETAPRARATTSVASVDGLQVTAIQDGVFPVTLSWSDLPEADWFSVFRGDERVAETAVPLFFDSPRKPEVSYTVKAHRDGRVLAAQTIRVRLPDPTIHEKPHVQTQVKNAGVVLSWPTSSPAEAYEVYRCAPDAPADGSHPIIQLEPSAGGTCTWRDRPPAGRWEYRVVPLNLVGRAGPAWQGVVDFAPVPVEPVLSLGLGAVPQEANVVGRVPCTADGAQLGEGHLVLKHRSEWDLNQAMTLSFEFKAQDVSGMPVLLCHGAWQIDGWFVQILNGALIVRTPNGDASGPAVEAGRWYAVVFIFDGDHLLLYVDGEQQPVQDGKVKAVPTTRDLLIGQYATAAPEFAFHGAIRKVMIYPDVVLPAPTR